MSGRDAIAKGERSELAGDYLDATAAYSSVLTEADGHLVALARFRLGRVAWKQGRFDDAVAQFDSARQLAVTVDDVEVRALVENGLGVIHQERGQLEQASACYNVALSLASDETQRGRILLNLGAIANTRGELDEARKYYQRSRGAFQRTQYRRGEALALHNLGMLYADESLWDEADEAYRHCLEILEAEGDRAMIARVLLNRSEVSCARERFDEAVARCDLAVTICTEIGDEVERGDALRWKGHALRLMGRHDAARKSLTAALSVATHTQAKLLEAETLRDLGLSMEASGDREGARKRLSQALDAFTQLGARVDVDDVREALARLGG